KAERTDERMLRRMCISTIIYAALAMASFWMSYFSMYSDAAGWAALIDEPLVELVNMLLLLEWLVFVDFTIFHSVDHIKRRYKQAVLHIVIVAVILISDSFVFYYADIDNPLFLDIWEKTLFLLIFAIEVLFVYRAYSMVRDYQKKMRPPLFLRLDLFVIPFFAGMVITLFTSISCRALGYSIGILLTWMTMRNRYKYLDKESGFYNSDFLEVMVKNAEKQGYPGGSAIAFRLPGKGANLAKVLEDEAPEESLNIACGNDCFVMLAETGWEKALQLLIKRVRVTCEDSDTIAKQGDTVAMQGGLASDYTIRGEGESVKDFEARVLEMIKKMREKEAAI
ncbi:MAG: hypothetical protein K6G03_11895, partial [Lachnospiraceae bacterium]|nr:hypothetical protein [Lachnospiraceae bacterium]